MNEDMDFDRNVSSLLQDATYHAEDGDTGKALVKAIEAVKLLAVKKEIKDIEETGDDK